MNRQISTNNFLAAIVGLLVAGWANSVLAQSVPCASLELQVAIVPTEPATCIGGASDDGDSDGLWEYIELYVDAMYVGVAHQRAGVRSIFYRPKLEEWVPDLLGEDADNVEWGAEIADERFDVRRFDVNVDSRTTYVCAGFLATGAKVMGSEVKQVIYGIFCNLDGSVFFDSDVTELLTKIGR
jgi:hypothetical protein